MDREPYLGQFKYKFLISLFVLKKIALIEKLRGFFISYPQNASIASTTGYFITVSLNIH